MWSPKATFSDTNFAIAFGTPIDEIVISFEASNDKFLANTLTLDIVLYYYQLIEKIEDESVKNELKNKNLINLIEIFGENGLIFENSSSNLIKISGGNLSILGVGKSTILKSIVAAFSILENNTFLLIMISILFLVFIDSYIKKEKLANLSKLSFGIMIGGVCGNLIDRLLRGGVIDYLSFEIFTYQFPVFNLADIAIVIGVLLFLISEECIFRMKKEEREK